MHRTGQQHTGNRARNVPAAGRDTFAEMLILDDVATDCQDGAVRRTTIGDERVSEPSTDCASAKIVTSPSLDEYIGRVISCRKGLAVYSERNRMPVGSQVTESHYYSAKGFKQSWHDTLCDVCDVARNAKRKEELCSVEGSIHPEVDIANLHGTAQHSLGCMRKMQKSYNSTLTL